MELVRLTQEFREVMNEAYWREFYSRPHTLEPSPFARWVGFTGKRVIDFGCGNGRDTSYLTLKGNDVVGVDPFAPEGKLYFRGTMQQYLATNPKNIDIAYCRFFLQAVDVQAQWLLLDWARSNRVSLYIEARSIKDTPNSDHERRLIDGNWLLSDLLHQRFYVTYYQEGYGLAPYGNEDPHIVRVIAEGKNP